VSLEWLPTRVIARSYKFRKTTLGIVTEALNVRYTAIHSRASIGASEMSNSLILQAKTLWKTRIKFWTFPGCREVMRVNWADSSGIPIQLIYPVRVFLFTKPAVMFKCIPGSIHGKFSLLPSYATLPNSRFKLMILMEFLNISKTCYLTSLAPFVAALGRTLSRQRCVI
jgi:hypothetical protein